MSWSSVPLTAGQLTKIRSASYAGDYLLTLCKNRVVFAGQVNSDLTTPQSWAQFNYSNVSVGAYTDVELDQVLIIGTTNNIAKGTFRGRVRKAPTSSILYSNESSEDFTVGAYFWIIDTYDLTYKLSRPSTNDPATAIELVNYEETYAPPRGVIVGLRTAYVDDVDPATGKLRIPLDVSANSYAVAHGDSISSYLFTFKAGTATVISGALASPTVTVDITPGEQWGKLTMTTANGQVKTRRFYIFAHDPANPPDTGFSEDQLTISGNVQSGWTMTCEAFTGVDAVLPNTFAVCRRANENYGGVAGGLDSTNNIAFVGWFQREDDTAQTDPAASITEGARFEFTGFGPRMAQIVAQQLPFINVTGATIWGHIIHLTPWRAICHFLERYTTVTLLSDLQFDDKSNAFEFPALSTTQGGNVAAAVGGITNQFNALLETASDGRLQVCRSAEYLGQAARNALTDYVDYTSQDALEISRQLEQSDSVGKVDADGAYCNLSTGQISVFTVRAPGIAQGEAQGSDTLSNQILTVTTSDTTALNELRQRAGDRLKVANNEETLTVRHFDGLTGLQPSKSMLYTFTVDQLDAQGVNRISYNAETLWMLEAVTYGRQGNGTTGVQGQYRRLPPVGDPGDNTTQVAENAVDDPMPDLGDLAFSWEDPAVMFPDVGLDQVNPAQLEPSAGQIASTKGQYLIAATASQAFWERNFITLKIPRCVDVTPTDLGAQDIQAVVIDPFFTKTAIPAYLLENDGLAAKVAYNPNAAAPSARDAWTWGAEALGPYNVLRSTNVNGGILIYAPSSGGTLTTYDFTVSNQGFTAVVDGGAQGQYTASVGWDTTDNTEGDGNRRRVIDILKTFAAAHVTAVRMKYSLTKGTFEEGCGGSAGSVVGVIVTGDTTDSSIEHCDVAIDGTNITFVWTGSVTNAISIETFLISSESASAPNWSGFARLTEVVVEVDGGGGSVARYSSDYGVTWGSELTIGTTPGSIGGFDVARASGVSYAAADQKVRKASALGGAYSDWYAITGGAQAVCVIIPYFDWSGARQTTDSTPDAIIALNQLDGSSRSLLWVEGDGTTVHDLTPVAGMIFDNPNCVTVSYNHHIAVFGKVGGVYHLYTTNDRGVTWVDRGTLTSPTFLRTRRNDDSGRASGTNKGQLYLASGSTIAYSSVWASGAGSIANLWPRTQPASPIVALDILY
jgi:hypothetical protein